MVTYVSWNTPTYDHTRIFNKRRRKIINLKFNARTVHTSSYYFNVITALVEGLRLGKTDRELAQYLNGKNLLSPIGNEWTAAAITKALWKLRHFRTVGSTLHAQLLQLAWDGAIKPADVLPLFSARNCPRMTM